MQNAGSENRKAYAAKMLKKFKWNESQRKLLEKMAANGYWIGTVNDAEKAFNLRLTENGAKLCILVYGYYSTKPWNKRLQTIHKTRG